MATMPVSKIPPMPQGRTYVVDEVDREALRISFENAYQNFYQLVGEYITRWAHFDRSLFEICQLALGADRETVDIIFYRSPNIGDHLSLTNKLLERPLRGHKQALLEWKSLHGRIDEGSQVRNYVAHQPVAHRAQKTFSFVPEIGNKNKITVEEAIFFIYNEELKPKKAKWDYIGPDELKHFLKEADALFRELIEFQDRLSSFLKEPRQE